MIRSVALLALCSSAVAFGLPPGPKFKEGGFHLGLEYGPGFFALDRPNLAVQVGQSNADVFVNEAQNTHTVAVTLGYNILGHASINANITATGWNLDKDTRGGGGFAGGYVAWHPLQLIFINKEERPIPLDFNLYFGAGYGIVGQHTGMDGLVWMTGLNVQFFFTRYFGIGTFARANVLNWSNFYLDYNNRSQPGATLPLPKGSGGAFWHLGFSLILRVGN